MLQQIRMPIPITYIKTPTTSHNPCYTQCPLYQTHVLNLFKDITETILACCHQTWRKCVCCAYHEQLYQLLYKTYVSGFLWHTMNFDFYGIFKRDIYSTEIRKPFKTLRFCKYKVNP